MEAIDFDLAGEIDKSLPTAGDLHINAALSNVAIAWKQESKRFAAGRMFGEVPSQKQSDEYYEWELGDFFRDEAELAGPNTPAPEMNLRLAHTPFNCKVWHIGGKVTEQDLANQDPAVDKETAIARAISQKLLIKRDVEWASAFFTTGKWTGSTTATDLAGGVAGGGGDFVYFDDFAASDPLVVVRRQISHLCRLGMDPMELVLGMSNDVWINGWVDHPKLIERYEQVQAGIMNEELLAAVLGIREVVVFRSSKNSAGETKTASVGYIHGKHMVLAVAPRVPAKDTPAAGYIFNWANLIGAGDDGMRIRRFPVNDPPGMKQVGDMAFAMQKTSGVCGVFFNGAVSP